MHVRFAMMMMMMMMMISPALSRVVIGQLLMLTLFDLELDQRDLHQLKLKQQVLSVVVAGMVVMASPMATEELPSLMTMPRSRAQKMTATARPAE